MTVTDDEGASVSDDVIIPVGAIQAPVADAGVDQLANVADGISLDGSGSSDSDGRIISSDWGFGDETGGASEQQPIPMQLQERTWFL